ncbi:MAG: hypothetical protein J6W49_04900 [Paludibacteraceae bacterium]|nr:hypothetical protein [Paludibacteraceae bacterium]
MTTRIQKLPETLWTRKPLDDKNVYVYYWINNIYHVTKVATPKEADEFICRCTNKGVGAFASAPIPCNNNQHGVFAFSVAGRTKQFALAKNVNESVKKAHDSVFQTITDHKKADNEEPCAIIVEVKYPGYNRLYSFRCQKWHEKNDTVRVYTNNKYQYVTVETCRKMKESEVKELAKRLGYDDIDEVDSDDVPQNEPEPEEVEYEEDFEALEAMRDAYRCGHDYEATSSDWDHVRDCEGEYDDLPE